VKLKRLNGVAHDLGHHAVSGLSSVPAHLFRVASTVDVARVAVSVLPLEYPEVLPEDKTLRRALESLHRFLLGLLGGLELGKEVVSGAIVEFSFLPDWPDTEEVRRLLEVSPRPYSSDPQYCCASTIVRTDGKTYIHRFESGFYQGVEGP